MKKEQQETIHQTPLHPDVEAAKYVIFVSIVLLSLAAAFDSAFFAVISLAFVIAGVIISPAYRASENTEPIHRL